MGTLLTIGLIIFIIYIVYRLFFIKSESFVQNAEIGIKSKQIYSNPDNPELYLKRGIVFARRGYNYQFNSNDLENASKYYRLAEEDYNKAIELKPNYAEAYFQKGILLWAKKQDTESYYTLVEAEKLGYTEATKFIAQNGMR